MAIKIDCALHTEDTCAPNESPMLRPDILVITSPVSLIFWFYALVSCLGASRGPRGRAVLPPQTLRRVISLISWGGGSRELFKNIQLSSKSSKCRKKLNVSQTADMVPFFRIGSGRHRPGARGQEEAAARPAAGGGGLRRGGPRAASPSAVWD